MLFDLRGKTSLKFALKRGTVFVLVALFVAGCTNTSPTGKGDESPATNEQAVLVYLKLSDSKFGGDAEIDKCFKLESDLEKVVDEAGVGNVDGNEVGGGEFTLFIYGPKADAIEKVILPKIVEFKPSKGSHYVKRYGSVDDDSAKEVDTPLGE